MSTSLIYHTQGLRDYKFLKVDYVKGKVIITVEQKESNLHCTCCNSKKFTAIKMSSRMIKGIPFGNKQTIFKVIIHRLRCHDCKKERQEAIPCTPESKVTYTRALARSVIELRPKMTITDVAEFLGLHWETVKNIEKKYLKKKYRTIRLRDVEIIGIDEFHTGSDYITIVRDLESGAVLHVGQGKSADALKQFERRLRSSKCKIKAVAVDLAPSFTAWVKKNLPDANIVYDHFHLIKLMNKKIDNLRRYTMKKADEEMKARLKNKRFLFLRNQENLDKESKQELDDLKIIFEDLGTATFMKECLRNIYSIAEAAWEAKICFEYWCKLADESGITCLKTMAKTIRRHIKGIIAYWDEHGLTSAKMEGFNNKVRWLMKQAYGYRDKDYFYLKIFDLPKVDLLKAI